MQHIINLKIDITFKKSHALFISLGERSQCQLPTIPLKHNKKCLQDMKESQIKMEPLLKNSIAYQKGEPIY